MFTTFFCIFISPMYIALFIQTADGHRGRVDFTSLSDQALMEMLVEGFSEHEMWTECIAKRRKNIAYTDPMLFISFKCCF